MAFATAAELASYLQVPQVDTYTAELVLDMATAAIQAATGQQIERVEDDEITLRAPYGFELRLPQQPADDPTVIEVDGTAVTDWSLNGGTLYRSAGWLAYDTITGAPQRVSVTYSHGYATIPGEIKRVCLQAAARAYRNPEGLRSETIGSESYAYANETQAAVDLTDEETKAVRRALGISGVGAVYLRT